MIYTVLLKIGEVSESLCDSLPDEVISHILAAKNEELRAERFTAYSLLLSATQKLFGKKPKIKWAENGKPTFENENIYFSISHTKGLASVSISDDCPLGVDVEGEISQDRALRLEKRFFEGICFSDSPLPVKYLYAESDNGDDYSFFELSEKDAGGITFSTTDDEKISLENAFHHDSFSARWTLYEATMKSGGGGFTSLPCLDMMLLDTRADIKKIKIDNDVYYLTTAVSG